MARIQINLLPGAARKRAVGWRLDPRAALAGVRDHVADKYTLSAAGAVLLAILGIGFMVVSSRGRAQDLAERERRAVQDSSRFATVLRARVQAETERDAVLRQLAIIRSIDDKRYIWPHLLQEISTALPPFTWLTGITQTSVPPNPAIADSTVIALRATEDTTKPAGRAKVQKARRDAAIAASRANLRFRIVGRTVDIQALTRFMRDLEASPFVQNVQLARSDLIPVEEKEITEFQLDAESEPPGPSEITVVPLSVEGR